MHLERLQDRAATLFTGKWAQDFFEHFADFERRRGRKPDQHWLARMFIRAAQARMSMPEGDEASASSSTGRAQPSPTAPSEDATREALKYLLEESVQQADSDSEMEVESWDSGTEDRGTVDRGQWISMRRRREG